MKDVWDPSSLQGSMCNDSGLQVQGVWFSQEYGHGYDVLEMFLHELDEVLKFFKTC